MAEKRIYVQILYLYHYGKALLKCDYNNSINIFLNYYIYVYNALYKNIMKLS